MCSLRLYLQQRLDALLPDERIELSQAGLTELLARHSHCGCDNDQDRARTDQRGIADTERASWTIRELARVVGLAHSTLRAHVARGLCGNPQQLRPNGGPYRVPGAVAVPLISHVRGGGRVEEFRPYSVAPAVAARQPLTGAASALQAGARVTPRRTGTSLPKAGARTTSRKSRDVGTQASLSAWRDVI